MVLYFFNFVLYFFNFVLLLIFPLTDTSLTTHDDLNLRSFLDFPEFFLRVRQSCNGLPMRFLYILLRQVVGAILGFLHVYDQGVYCNGAIH